MLFAVAASEALWNIAFFDTAMADFGVAITEIPRLVAKDMDVYTQMSVSRLLLWMHVGA